MIIPIDKSFILSTNTYRRSIRYINELKNYKCLLKTVWQIIRYQDKMQVLRDRHKVPYATLMEVETLRQRWSKSRETVKK